MISVKGILEDVHTRNITPDQAEEILLDQICRVVKQAEDRGFERGYAKAVEEAIQRLRGEKEGKK